jgi:hypothetical protein
MSRHVRKEDLEALLKEYTDEVHNSNPPPSKAGESMSKLVSVLVGEIESLKKSRSSLGDVLGVRVHDSGTFEPVDQTTVDLMFARQELQAARNNLAQEREAHAATKKVVEKWGSRKDDWMIRIAFAFVAALVTYVWHALTTKGTAP